MTLKVFLMETQNKRLWRRGKAEKQQKARGWAEHAQFLLPFTS
jgi:hypothetical protein